MRVSGRHGFAHALADNSVRSRPDSPDVHRLASCYFPASTWLPFSALAVTSKEPESVPIWKQFKDGLKDMKTRGQSTGA